MSDFFGQQPSGGPFEHPWEDPLEDPLADPLERLEDPFEAMQNALDNSTGLPPVGEGVCPPDPDFFMDPLGQTLSRPEESIEGTTEAPPPKFEEPLVSPEPPAPINTRCERGAATT